MQALSPTEDSVKQSASTMLTWKEPVVVETPSPTSALRSSKSKSYGASGSPAPGPGGDLLGVNAVNGQSFKPQKQQYGPMNILHNCMHQNGHQEFGSPFMENSRQNGIPESVMVMPMIDSKLSSASTRSNSSSPPSSRKAVRSRARPRKPEEPVPFLSVDTLPADKAVMEGKSYSSKQLSKKQGRSVPKRISPEFIHPTAGRRSQTPNHPPFSPYGGGKSTPRVPSRAGSSLHNYNSFFTHKNSAFLAGPPSLWSLGNRFWPHQATPNEGRRRLAPIQAPMVLEASTLKANYQLSQPFKHNVDNSTPIERPVSPGQELKESTMLALHEVTQALARQQDPPPSRKGGRLLKGKLKPLHTFKMDGPGMDECQGILTEDNRGQTADKALLLQRKKELLSMLPPDVFQRSTTGSSLHTRPETQGSVHRNSIVSALSLDRDNPANHPSIQPVQLRSQSMVEEAGPVGPFNSMVMMIDDNIFNQVDIPAVEVQQEGGDPEAKGPETMDCLRTSAKEEGTAVQDPERLMAGGDADKLSDDVSESNMSDYLSELEGGRAEILCNMVKKNSQARNDLTQLDNEPSDATELENGYDDEYPLDSVQQKYPALDSAAMSDDRVGNRKVTTAMKSESQPNLDDNDSINSKNVVPDTVTVDRNESKSDHPEQSYSPSILKDSITQSYVVAETDEQSEGSMQSENKQETIPTEEHLEQPVVSIIETKVPEKAITDKETKINVYGLATLHEQNKMIMQNASEDVSNGTKLEDNIRESNNDSNTNTVPVNESLRNESQNSNNIPSISLVDGSVKAAVENDIVSNNVEGTPLREGSAEGASSPADDAVAGTPNSDPVLRTGIDALAITLVNEKDVSIVSSKIEQNSPAGDQQQIETAVPKEILSNTADHQSVSVIANISESVVTQNCENDVVKQSNEELLSSAMKEDSDKEVEKKEEEEVDDDAKDTKEKDNGNDGDRGMDGGNGNNGDSGTGGGNGNNGDSGTGGGSGNSGTGGGNGSNGDSGTGGGNGNDGDSGTGGGNGNDGDRGTGGGNGNDGDSGTGGSNGNDGDSGTGGGNGNDGDSGTGGGNDSGTGGGNGNDGDSGTGGGNGNDGDRGTGGGNGNDGDSGTGGGNGNDGDRGTGGGNGNDGDSGTGGGSGSGTGQGSNSHNDNGGGALGGGGGGGERDGDRNNKDENPGDNKNGNSNNHTEDKEVESEEENRVICFKSLEQLLQEIQAQSSCRKEELLSYNDIPEVDDPVLYCDSCGLDEDTCVCPNSSLHRFLGQDEFQNRSELEDEELFDESSQQQNIVLEYEMLLGEPHPGIGCYSTDLLSSREAWNEDGQHASRLSRAKPNSGVPYDIMLTTGVAMTQVQRPISAKVRPGSSKPSRPSSHRGPNGGRGGAKVSLEDADMSDSGCGSEMSEALTQPSQLLTDEMEKDYNLDDDLDLKAQHQEHFGTETSENVSKSANLEIVASTKPRHAKNKTDDTPLLAPFPPLCFKINARPPPGKLYYFSYGATMNPTRLSTYIGSKVDQRLWGILFGFALQFNKKGQDIEAGGFANIEFSPESSVEGCVYCLNPSQLNSLDKFMGCPEFYTKIILPVWMANCTDPNKFGVAQYCIPAVMYIAQDKWTHTDGSAPLASEYSIRQCMKGADLLSPAYKQHLQTLVC